jgi:hypothetical protein
VAEKEETTMVLVPKSKLMEAEDQFSWPKALSRLRVRASMASASRSALTQKKADRVKARNKPKAMGIFLRFIRGDLSLFKFLSMLKVECRQKIHKREDIEEKFFNLWGLWG